MSGVRGILSLLCLGTALSPVGFGADDKLPPHREGLVLVKFRPDAAAAPALNATLLGLGANIAARTTSGTLMLNVGSGRVSAVVDLLKSRSDVLFAEPDYASSPTGVTQSTGPSAGFAQNRANGYGAARVRADSPVELVFAGVGMMNFYSGTITAGAGYSLLQQDSGSSRAANGLRDPVDRSGQRHVQLERQRQLERAGCHVSARPIGF